MPRDWWERITAWYPLEKLSASKRLRPSETDCTTLVGAYRGGQASNISPRRATQPYERGSTTRRKFRFSPQSVFGLSQLPVSHKRANPGPCMAKRPDPAARRHCMPHTLQDVEFWTQCRNQRASPGPHRWSSTKLGPILAVRVTPRACVFVTPCL